MDPLDLIDRYGADPLRFTLAAMAAQGRDIKMSTVRLESYRNFATKIWNACRFLKMNDCTDSADDYNLSEVQEPINKWIVSEYNNAIIKTSEAIETYRFNDAAEALYQFIRHSYCDWYVELIKPQLLEEAAETRAVAANILAGAVKLLHPFMPYLTEELNNKVFGSSTLMIAATWPKPAVQNDGEAVEDLRFVIRLISDIRHLRAEMNVPLSATPMLHLRSPSVAQKRAVEGQKPALLRLARINGVAEIESFEKGSVRSSVDGLEIGLPLAGVLDFASEAGRLEKELASIDREISKISGKLNNEAFLAKAPAHVVEENKRRLGEETTRKKILDAALSRINNAS